MIEMYAVAFYRIGNSSYSIKTLRAGTKHPVDVRLVRTEVVRKRRQKWTGKIDGL